MQTLTDAVHKPINVVMGFGDPTLTLEQLGAIGVKRISIGGALSRIALQSFMEAARELRSGRFTFVGKLEPLSFLQSGFEGE